MITDTGYSGKIEISTSNHMFRRAIWDRLAECIFEDFKIA